MKRFADLLERLVYTNSRNEKLQHLSTYFTEVVDPARGLAVAAIAGTLDIPNVTPKVIRTLAEDRVDPKLFRLSYDFVGDLAETTSLIWPSEETAIDVPLDAGVNALTSATRRTIPAVLAGLLDRLGQSERLALLKLATGGLRVGVSARLLKTALAQYGGKNVETIEELWSGLRPPYTDLFMWLEGRAPEPNVDRTMLFRPAMLAHPLEAGDLSAMSADDYVAEWKWDGIRVQAVAFNGERRLYTRTGEDIGHSFPDILAHMKWEGVVDGELLIVRDKAVQPFDQLQKRLGRRAPTDQFMADFPAHIFAYDLLETKKMNLRPHPFAERRRLLENWFQDFNPERMALSELLPILSWSALERLRDDCRDMGYEGLVLKRRNSPYLAGRVKGHWYKWKRDPLSADCVLMYAQRGHGRRSSYYSDYTFGCWTETGGELNLVPVGKAYSGYTDNELLKLDKFVRDNTSDRFGPVRAVRPGLVLEVAFDSVQLSTRHKSGISMRFPRIKRIRWDKPVGEADTVGILRRMIDRNDLVRP